MLLLATMAHMVALQPHTQVHMHLSHVCVFQQCIFHISIFISYCTVITLVFTSANMQWFYASHRRTVVAVVAFVAQIFQQLYKFAKQQESNAHTYTDTLLRLSLACVCNSTPVLQLATHKWGGSVAFVVAFQFSNFFY